MAGEPFDPSTSSGHRKLRTEPFDPSTALRTGPSTLRQAQDTASSGHRRLRTGSCIVVQDLWYSYDGEVTALRGIDLEIEDGDYVAVIGQNGSGKTTLVKHFNGLLKPTRGQVLVKLGTGNSKSSNRGAGPLV